MHKLRNVVLSLTLVTFVAACGTSRTDRALSGGAIGAGAGAVGGALIPGVNPVTGAIVGGAIGAAAGAVTKKKDVDLGEPVWK